MAFPTKKSLSDLFYRAQHHLSALIPGISPPPIIRHERHADIVIEGDLPPRSELNSYFGSIEIKGKVGRECCVTSVFGAISIDGGIGADSAVCSTHKSVIVGRSGRGDLAAGVSVHSVHGDVVIAGERAKETNVVSRFGYIVIGEEALERFKAPVPETVLTPPTVLPEGGNVIPFTPPARSGGPS